MTGSKAFTICSGSSAELLNKQITKEYWCASKVRDSENPVSLFGCDSARAAAALQR
jgi:hypothetical protein